MKNSDATIFIYIQKTDTGLAPCVYRGVWTLALCKPTIRRRSGTGDIVIAVTEKEDGHRLSSWARIDKRITTKEFSDQFPKSRPDNIYDTKRAGQFRAHYFAGVVTQWPATGLCVV